MNYGLSNEMFKSLWLKDASACRGPYFHLNDGSPSVMMEGFLNTSLL